MTFSFSCPADQETFMSLKGLSNKNNGFFKTVKQAQFLFKQYTQVFNSLHTRAQVRENFGVIVADDQITVEVTAYTRWADYGSRSVIPVLYVFVLDKHGVVASYKVGGTGNLRDGWSPDPTKTKMLWVRSDDAVCPWSFPTEQEIAAQKAAEPVSNWLGYVGDKVEAKVMLVRSRAMGYSQFGEMFLSVLRDEIGNIINVWRDLGLKEGEVVNIKGTIKSTEDYKGTKQTTLIRVKVF